MHELFFYNFLQKDICLFISKSAAVFFRQVSLSLRKDYSFLKG